MARRKSSPRTEHPDLPSPPPNAVSSTPFPALVTGEANNQVTATSKETSNNSTEQQSTDSSNVTDSENQTDGVADSGDRVNPDENVTSTSENLVTRHEEAKPGLDAELDHAQTETVLNDLAIPPNSKADSKDDSDLPEPYVSDETTLYPERNEKSTPQAGAEPLIEIKLAKITDVEKFEASLEKAEAMPIDQLYGRVYNAYRALVAYQDEWLDLDKAIKKNTLSKLNSEIQGFSLAKDDTDKSRQFVNPRIPKPNSIGVGYQDQIEAFVYGYTHNPHPQSVGKQDPIKQRIIDDSSNGRLLRQRVPTQKAAEAETTGGESEDENGRPRRTRVQRRLDDSDDVSMEGGRGARTRYPSSRLGSEAPDQPAFKTFSSGKRVGRPPASSRQNTDKSGVFRVQELKNVPGDSPQPRDNPFISQNPSHLGLTTGVSALHNPNYWTERPGQGVFDSRPGTSSTTVTNPSSRSSDSQPSLETDIEYTSGRKRRQNTSDFEDALPYKKRISQADSDMLSPGAEFGETQSGQDNATGAKSMKRSEGGKAGWIKRKARAAEKAQSLKQEERDGTEGSFDDYDEQDDLAPSYAPSNTFGTSTPEAGKPLSRSERSRRNQLNAWAKDDGSRREKSSRAMTQRWAAVKAAKAAGGAGTLAGTSTKPKPALTTTDSDASATASVPVSTDPAAANNDAKTKLEKGQTPASRNMLNRWAKRKEAEAAGLIPPRIGRIKQPGGSAKDSPIASGTLQANPTSISPAITPAPAQDSRKRKHEAEDVDLNGVSVGTTEIAPPRKRSQKNVDMFKSFEQGVADVHTPEEQQAPPMDSSLGSVSKSSSSGGKRSRKATTLDSMEPREGLDIQSQETVDTEYPQDTKADQNGLNVPQTEQAESSFQPRKSGRVRRETSVARSYQSERRSSKSSQKLASTPISVPGNDDAGHIVPDDINSIQSGLSTRSRRQSRASLMDGPSNASISLESSRDVMAAPTLTPAIPPMAAPLIPMTRNRAGKAIPEETHQEEPAVENPEVREQAEQPAKRQQNGHGLSRIISLSTKGFPPGIPGISAPEMQKKPDGGHHVKDEQVSTEAATEEPSPEADTEVTEQLKMEDDGLENDGSKVNTQPLTEAERIAAAKAAKSAKMSASLKRRWASGSMAGAVAKRKATAAARRAGDPSSASSSTKKKRVADATPSTATPSAPKRARRAPAARATPAQTDGAADDDNDDDSSSSIESGPRKISEYERFQELSSPQSSPLGRGRRPAALKASQSFSRYGDVTEDDDEIDDVGMAHVYDTPSKTPAAVAGAAEENEEETAEDVDTEIKRQFASEYDHYQALTSPDPTGPPVVLGKRVRKPVINLKEAMAIEAGDEFDDDDFEE